MLIESIPYAIMVNDNFKEVDDEFEIEEEQVCMVVMSDDMILAGYFEEPEPTSEDRDDPLWIPSLDLQGCHKSEDGGKTWIRVAGNEGMSYCELDRDHVLGIYIPKEELDLDACMKLWS